MSNIKIICSSAAKSQEYSKSSSKKLFESVFKMLDNDELEVSPFDQADTNGSRITNILGNSDFRQALAHKIQSEGLLETYPILKASCFDKRDVNQKLDVEDVQSVFQKFGNLYMVYSLPDEVSCYIFFTSFSSAYVAMKLLNGFTIRYSLAQLYVNWCPHTEYDQFSSLFTDYHSKVQWNLFESFQNGDKYSQLQNNNNQKQNKLTCRYDIQIDNQKQFQVARRIIGAKGINMKKIIQAAIEAYSEQQGNNSSNNQILKLRLRGKGSGYKEGPDQIESDENLHLCISAKDQLVYNHACENVQKLLKGVYNQYEQFTRKHGNMIVLAIKKIDINSQSSQSDGRNMILENGRMDPYKIEQYLQLRNKARRELNFGEADRIRNYLRTCGVCLIDQKGKRGKAAEVTTWKYLL